MVGAKPRAARITAIAAVINGWDVVSGAGRATVNGGRGVWHPGTLLLIERGDLHEIRTTGRTPLQTLNVHVPPAYARNGDPLPRHRK